MSFVVLSLLKDGETNTRGSLGLLRSEKRVSTNEGTFCRLSSSGSAVERWAKSVREALSRETRAEKKARRVSRTYTLTVGTR